MATKKISDLTLRSGFDETCIVPVDDATQTWRVTGAQMLTFLQSAANVATIWAAFTAKTSSVGDDVLVMLDSAASYATKKITRANLFKKTVRTATTTDSPTDADDVVLCNAASAGFTVNLPAASGRTGKVFTFKKTDSTTNVVTLDGNASETIDGATTRTLTLQYEAVNLVCDGSNWHIV
jgi:hypothetical protein